MSDPDVGTDVEASRTACGLLAGLHRPVAVLGSWQVVEGTALWRQAEELGRLLVEAGHGVVTGGGLGSMAAVSRGAHDAGAPAAGLFIPLPGEPEPNPWAGPVVVFHDYAARRAAMLQGLHAVVALPGGLGTLDEVTHVLTLAQVGQTRPCATVLVGRAHWQPFVAWLREVLVGAAMVAPSDLAHLHVVDGVAEAVQLLTAQAPS